MKILMLSAHFDLPQDSCPVGGVQRHISGITNELRKLGNVVDWNYPSRIKPDEIDAKYDVVICHDFFVYQDNVKNIPRIIVFHGWEGKYPLNPTVVKRRQEISQNAEGVINIGHSITEMYGSKDGRILYGGIDIPENFKEPKYNSKNNKYLIVTRIKPDATILPGIKLAKMLDIPCAICGDGDQDIKNDIKKEMPNVEFKGFVDDPSEFFDNVKYIQIGGYLAMMEAFLHKKIVVGFYNTIGRKYRLTCVSDEFKIFVGEDEHEVLEEIEKYTEAELEEIVEKNYRWVTKNTYKDIAKIYIEEIENAKRRKCL